MCGDWVCTSDILRAQLICYSQVSAILKTPVRHIIVISTSCMASLKLTQTASLTTGSKITTVLLYSIVKSCSKV
jgi:hypothetical protein